MITDSIRTAVLAACCTAIGLTAAEYIVPLEKFEKQIRLIFAIIMMTVILTPLTKIGSSSIISDIPESQFTAEEITENARRMQEQAAAEGIRTALNHALTEKESGCTVESVTVHIPETGGIDIIEVKVTGNLLTGTVCLREWLGDSVTITEGGEPDA